MDHFGRLLKQANNNMMRHFDQFARQYDLTGNQMAVIDFITNHVDQEVFQMLFLILEKILKML